MKKFNFFKGYQRVHSDPYNGVTSQYLIQLSIDVLSYSDWIFSTMLTNNNGTSEDKLIVDFKDIDGAEYSCLISHEGSFKISQIITLPDGEIELINSLDITNEVLSDVENLLQYFLGMPKTIANSL